MKKLIIVIIGFFIILGCNNKKSPNRNHNVKYNGFLFPKIANCLHNSYNKPIKSVYQYNRYVSICEFCSKDYIAEEEFLWVKTKQHVDSIPEFLISKFKLPKKINENVENDYESLGSFSTFLNDSLHFKYDKDYISTSLYEEESYWRYMGIRMYKSKLSFLTGIQLVNYILSLNQIESKLYYGDNFKLWYAVKDKYVYNKKVRFLYKVIEFKEYLFIAVEMDTQKSLSEITDLLKSKDADNEQRKHILMELYDYKGY